MTKRTALPVIAMVNPLVLWSLVLLPCTSAFLIQNNADSVVRRRIHSLPSPSRQTSLLISLHSSSPSDDWNAPDEEEVNNFEPERSKIPDYIAAYLRKENSVETFSPTHMVGIPMDACHELLIELESVQRAILYHCPVLVHSCIVASMTRLPLLYVDASYQPAGRVTMELQAMTQRIVLKHCFAAYADARDDTDLGGAGEDGYKPLTLNFHKLEVDGDAHDVLYTKAVQGEEGTLKLIAMVQDLQREVEAKGWMTQFPSNPHEPEFFPRIPFMRLPNDFARHLEAIPENDFRTPEQGGNGISPIFWCKWWDDYMGRSVRLREVGIYPKRPAHNAMDESTFYIPHETIALPGGNAKLSKLEQKHAKYNEERMADAEKMIDQDEADTRDAMFDPSLEANRKILEELYQTDAVPIDGLVSIGDDPFVEIIEKEENTLISSTVQEEEQRNKNAVIDKGSANSKYAAAQDAKDTTTPPLNPDNTDDSPSRKPMSDWMEDRIRTIIESRASAQQRRANTTKRDGLPSIEDNPILNAYKAGRLVEKDVSSSASSAARISPLFPSRESLIGFWKVVQSPTGFAEETGDETQTDNLVLRVDGTTSGGPILDQEFRQKAAGGTWKLIEEDDGRVRLRIRLVMTPKKDRILVMDGYVVKGSASIDTSASLLTSAIIGATENDMEDTSLKCRGDVWLEDAVTKKNRKDIGTFFIKKLETSRDPRDYTITIPNPVRSQD